MQGVCYHPCMADLIHLDDYRTRIRCGSCSHELAETSPDGNELRTIVGTTTEKFTLRCPWCHRTQVWRPFRHTKKSTG